MRALSRTGCGRTCRAGSCRAALARGADDSAGAAVVGVGLEKDLASVVRIAVAVPKSRSTASDHAGPTCARWDGVRKIAGMSARAAIEDIGLEIHLAAVRVTAVAVPKSRGAGNRAVSSRTHWNGVGYTRAGDPAFSAVIGIGLFIHAIAAAAVSEFTTLGAFDVYQVNQAWTETGLNHTNQPPLGISATGGNSVSVTPKYIGVAQCFIGKSPIFIFP